MIGKSLNHYKILAKLGSGGMGEVFEAEDTRLGRKVALKILPETLATDPTRRERFQREAKAIAALNHPNIVTIYSVEEAGKVHFLTMELIRGKPLSDSIPPHGLPLRDFLDLAIPLTDALAAAHHEGITHRDLKPENVLVTETGLVKVLDFGLAKRQEPKADGVSNTQIPTVQVTQEGHILGTVAYMSPEQAEGRPVDPRSDVFSLGILFYEMATGRRPFQGATAISVISAILKDTPKRITHFNPRLPGDMARIVNRCLQKEPGKRFQSAQGLRTELDLLKQDVDSGEVVAPEAGPPAAASKMSPVTLAGWALAGLAVAAVSLWGLGVFRPASRIPAPSVGGSPDAAVGTIPVDSRKKIVVLPFENLGAADDAYFAAGMTEEITSRLAAAHSLAVISRTSAIQYDRTGKTIRDVGRDLGVDYVLEGTVQWDRRAGNASRVRVTPQLIKVADDTHLWSDRYDRTMEDIFEVQSEIASAVVDQLGIALSAGERQVLEARPTENLDAYQAYLQGKEILFIGGVTINYDDWHRAVELFEKAVELDPRFALAWARLSIIHSQLYHFRQDLTEERLMKAREAADRALRLQPDLTEAHLALGYYYYWGRKDYQRALEELAKASKGQDGNAEILEAVGYIYRRLGKFAEAIENFKKAFRLNPQSYQLCFAITDTYGAIRKYSEGEQFWKRCSPLAPNPRIIKIRTADLHLNWSGDVQQARTILRALSEPENPDEEFYWVHLALLDRDFEDALERLSRIDVEVLDTQIEFVPRALFEGLIHFYLGDGERARLGCEEGRRILTRENARNPRDPRTRAAMGFALACLGRKEEAIREATLAIDLYPITRDAIGGPTYIEDLAMVYALVGETEAALDRLEYLVSIPSEVHFGTLKLHPVWDRLRDHPRFRKILETSP